MHGITVIVPVWHGRSYVARALASVRQQTILLPIQIVVIEDGTPLNAASVDIAKAFNAEYIRLEYNRGVAWARRIGAQQAAFDSGFLAFLDQDDSWDPDFLSSLVEVLVQNPKAGFALSDAMVVYPGHRQEPLYQTRIPTLSLYAMKLFNQIVSPSQVLMRLESYRRVQWPVINDTAGVDDWLLWLAFLSQGFDGVYEPTPLVTCHEHPGAAHHAAERLRESEAHAVNEGFRALGFSIRDVHRYWALQHLKEPRPGLWLNDLRKYPIAFLEAGWYCWERHFKNWV